MNKSTLIRICIACCAVALVVLAVLVFVLVRNGKFPGWPGAAGTPVEFVSATSTAWYTFSGTSLAPATAPNRKALVDAHGNTITALAVPALPVATGTAAVASPSLVWSIQVTHTDGTSTSLGLGRPLGFLPDGSLLALTPLGLSRVTQDGTSFQIVSAGGSGSSTPIGAAFPDLSLVAFQNFATGNVVVYRFDPAKLTATYLGEAVLSASDTTTSTDATAIAAKLATLATTTDGSYTQAALVELRGWVSVENQKARPPLRAESLALTPSELFVKDMQGRFFAFPVTAKALGVPTELTLIETN